eukprot:m.437108 g.437108  ORF g.437108 m.437108 type:complete len:76 (-) comp21430_c0_seq3:242-469(-)
MTTRENEHTPNCHLRSEKEQYVFITNNMKKKNEKKNLSSSHHWFLSPRPFQWTPLMLALTSMNGEFVFSYLLLLA